MTISLYVALLLLAGLTGGWLATKINLPSVTGYIICGLLLGPSVLNIITGEVYNSLSFVSEIALGLLAISVGTELHRDMIKKLGRDLTILSLGNTLLSFILVTAGTYFMGMPITYATILGALSLTVSPSGVVAMIKERKASGEMTQTLLGLVAFDNLIAILVFGFAMGFVETAGNIDMNGLSLVLNVLSDVVFAGIIGLVSAFFVSFFIRKKLSNDKLLVIIGAAILFNSGIATILGLSPVLVNIVSGAAITNLTNRKVLVGQIISRIELPIFVIFLTLAGAHLDIAILGVVGLVGLAYIICRSLGRFFGIIIFSRFTSLNIKTRQNIGYGLLPQAGIAIGLATIAEQRIPGTSGIITGVVLTGALAFEIFGPLLLSNALKRTGEASA